MILHYIFPSEFKYEETNFYKLLHFLQLAFWTDFANTRIIMRKSIFTDVFFFSLKSMTILCLLNLSIFFSKLQIIFCKLSCCTCTKSKPCPSFQLTWVIISCVLKILSITTKLKSECKKKYASVIVNRFLFSSVWFRVVSWGRGIVCWWAKTTSIKSVEKNRQIREWIKW